MKYVRRPSKGNYYLPTHKEGEGEVTTRISIATHNLYWQAIKTVAEEETQRIGAKVSPFTLLVNLSMQGANEFRRVQTRITETYQQLNRGDKHHVNNTQTAQEALDTEVQ